MIFSYVAGHFSRIFIAFWMVFFFGRVPPACFSVVMMAFFICWWMCVSFGLFGFLGGRGLGMGLLVTGFVGSFRCSLRVFRAVSCSCLILSLDRLYLSPICWRVWSLW